MTALAVTARKFHQRPSELLAIQDPVLALNLDLAACSLLNEVEDEILSEMGHGD